MTAGLPGATYRLQLSREFGFDQARRLVPYLKALGISHLYASPFLKARAGSRHGYDVVDHAALNPEFGGEPAFLRLSDALHAAGLGLILDFVPNHMGIGYADNGWWLDVLEWGRQSPYARVFDISWELLPYRHGGGVLLPVLGRPYGEALTSGEIALRFDAEHGTFSAWYFDHRFPITPHRYGDIVRTVVAAAGAGATPTGRALIELADAYPAPNSPTYGQAPAYKARLAAIDGAAAVIARGLEAYRADHDNGRHALHWLLERQNYRLASWRVAVSGINYRRFFDVNDLAGVRVEDIHTFRMVHALVRRLIAEGRLQGLRIDHIDGLRDPHQYSRRLRQMIRSLRGADAASFHVTVEKILGEGEELPRFPGVHGTTGYEWLNLLSRVLLEERGLPALDETWRRFSGEPRDFSAILAEAKERVLDTILASDFTTLAQLLARIAAGHYSTRDYTPDRLSAALRLYVVAFPVYRSYVTTVEASPADRETIGQAIAAARRRWPGPDLDIFDFLYAAMTLDLLADGRAYSRRRVQDFALRLQQFTGPLMAKSLEDTAFYRYHRLLALNEVGNDPSCGGIDSDAFHAAMRTRATAAPAGLTATATHDTKRGEDARMRILALAELADDWAGAVAQWRGMNGGLRSTPDAPSAAHEYMLYQALIGAWPLEGISPELTRRVCAYAIKAAREGKQQTSWINVDDGYERALEAFVAAMLDPKRSGPFLQSFARFASRTALLGALNSLSQLGLKAMLPGIPDFYQGTELWDLSLVDPDNRRPVDFEARRRMMEGGALQAPWSTLADAWPNGTIKFALTSRLLAIRAALREMFLEGEYEPLAVQGEDRAHVIAFARRHRGEAVIVMAGRHFSRSSNGGRVWPRGGLDARIVSQGDEFFDLLTPGADPVALDAKLLLDTLPVAVVSSRPL